MKSNSSILVGDIGGTNARFAICRTNDLSYEKEVTLLCRDFGSPEAAIRHYLSEVDEEVPSIVCLAVAGPVLDGTVEFTNSHWRVDELNLSKTFNLDAVRLINDFLAVALAVPVLTHHHLVLLGDQEMSPEPAGPWCVGVIGPGTGLGAAGLIHDGDKVVPLLTEAGHAGFAPATPVQAEILNVLSRRFDRVSVERLISGPGIENLYLALADVRGVDVQQRHAADIFQASEAETDATAMESVDIFFQILGQTAGDFALNIGAFDGVYLAGGVVQRCEEQLRSSRFRDSFEDKGRLGVQLKTTPTALITHGQPGLLGALEMARRMEVKLE